MTVVETTSTPTCICRFALSEYGFQVENTILHAKNLSYFPNGHVYAARANNIS